MNWGGADAGLYQVTAVVGSLSYAGGGGGEGGIKGADREVGCNGEILLAKNNYVGVVP